MATLMYNLVSCVVIKNVLIVNVMHRIPEALEKCTLVSPYMPGLLCYKMEFKDGLVSYSEAFDSDDPTLIDRHLEYDTDKHLGDRLPTPT